MDRSRLTNVDRSRFEKERTPRLLVSSVIRLLSAGTNRNSTNMFTSIRMSAHNIATDSIWRK